MVELDGGHHAEASARDSFRTRLLEERGCRVLRFWDNEVLTNIEGVLEAILDAAASAKEMDRDLSDLSRALSLDKERE